MPMSPAQRRYTRRILALALAYAALLFLAVFLLKHHLATGPLAYVVGLLPAVPVTGFFGAVAAYIMEEHDEYLRMLIIRQSLIATGVAMSGATVWGFLEAFDLAPHAVGYTWPILWFAGLGVGGCFNALVERRAA